MALYEDADNFYNKPINNKIKDDSDNSSLKRLIENAFDQLFNKTLNSHILMYYCTKK